MYSYTSTALFKFVPPLCSCRIAKSGGCEAYVSKPFDAEKLALANLGCQKPGLIRKFL